MTRYALAASFAALTALSCATSLCPQRGSQLGSSIESCGVTGLRQTRVSSSSESSAFFVMGAPRFSRLVVHTEAVVVKLPSTPCKRKELAYPSTQVCLRIAVLAVVVRSAQNAFEDAPISSRGV